MTTDPKWDESLRDRLKAIVSRYVRQGSVIDASDIVNSAIASQSSWIRWFATTWPGTSFTAGNWPVLATAFATNFEQTPKQNKQLRTQRYQETQRFLVGLKYTPHLLDPNAAELVAMIGR